MLKKKLAVLQALNIKLKYSDLRGFVYILYKDKMCVGGGKNATNLDKNAPAQTN